MTNAITNYGTLLKRGNGATPEVFSAIAEVINIKPPGVSHPAEEATGHQSGVAHREFIKTALIELEEFTCEINYVPTGDDHDAGAGLLADTVSTAARNFKIVFPDALSTTWSFAAFVTHFDPSEADAQKPEPLKAEVTFRPTGTPTLA